MMPLIRFDAAPQIAAEVRASDADRAATAELLQRHYAAGRLETQEFEERIGRSYEARTTGQLHDLVVDLPQLMARELGADRGHAANFPVGGLAMVAPLALALVVAAGLTGAHVVWLAWPLAFFALRAWLWRGGRRWSW
jgi:hypothetical protein